MVPVYGVCSLLETMPKEGKQVKSRYYPADDVPQPKVKQQNKVRPQRCICVMGWSGAIARPRARMFPVHRCLSAHAVSHSVAPCADHQASGVHHTRNSAYSPRRPIQGEACHFLEAALFRPSPRDR